MGMAREALGLGGECVTACLPPVISVRSRSSLVQSFLCTPSFTIQHPALSMSLSMRLTTSLHLVFACSRSCAEATTLLTHARRSWEAHRKWRPCASHRCLSVVVLLVATRQCEPTDRWEWLWRHLDLAANASQRVCHQSFRYVSDLLLFSPFCALRHSQFSIQHSAFHFQCV